jgi:hypothetical protein
MSAKRRCRPALRLPPASALFFKQSALKTTTSSEERVPIWIKLLEKIVEEAKSSERKTLQQTSLEDWVHSSLGSLESSLNHTRVITGSLVCILS